MWTYIKKLFVNVNVYNLWCVHTLVFNICYYTKTNNLFYSSIDCIIMQEVTLSMEKQIELFRKTVQEYLPSHFSSAIELKDYLSKSIFLVIIGSNDYSHNYLSTQYNSSRIYDMKQFADLLTYYLKQQLLVSN